MRKKIFSTRGLFGAINHYDEEGHYIGYTQEGIFGQKLHYGADGHQVGFSVENIFGG